MYQNVRGVISKMVSLLRIVQEEEPSVLAETHLLEGEEIKIPGYCIARKDRDGKGGGCLIAYQEKIESLVTEIPEKETEMVWILIENGVAGVKIGVVYCPTEDYPKKDIVKVYDELEEEIQQEKDRQTTMICGDFNAKIFVEEGEKVKGSGVIMKDFVKRNSLHVINQGVKCEGKWTRTQGDSKSIIDYVLTSRSDAIVEKMIIDEAKDFSVYHQQDGETIFSDHFSIKVQLNWLAMTRELNDSKKIMIMTQAGMENYKYNVNKAKLSDKIDTGNDLDEEYEKWSSQVKMMYEKEMKSVTRRNEWKVNRLLMKQIKRLKVTSKKGKLSKLEEKMVQQRIALLREHCDEEIITRNAMKVSNMVKSIMKNGKRDMTQFWKFNQKPIQRESVSKVWTEDGVLLEENSEILEEYIRHHRTLLSKKEPESEKEIENESMVNQMIRCLEVCTNNDLYQPTTPKEVSEAISTLKKKKAKDSEGWCNEFMINGGEEMEKGLSTLFSMMDKQKKTPKQWERMKIRSLFKERRKQIDKTRGLFMTNVV